MNKYIGRRLGEILPDLPHLGPGQYYYIGSKSSYFWAATEKELRSDSETVDDELIDKAIRLTESYKKQLAEIRNAPKRKPDESEDDYTARVRKWEGRRQWLEDSTRRWRAYIKEFTPIMQREVTDFSRRKCLNDGYAILIEGVEPGDIWFRDDKGTH